MGAHEGPQTQALQLAGDPLTPPLVPPGGQTPPAALATAQGAAFFGMLEEYCDNTKPGAFQASARGHCVYFPLGSHFLPLPVGQLQCEQLQQRSQEESEIQRLLDVFPCFFGRCSLHEVNGCGNACEIQSFSQQRRRTTVLSSLAGVVFTVFTVGGTAEIQAVLQQF